MSSKDIGTEYYRHRLESDIDEVCLKYIRHSLSLEWRGKIVEELYNLTKRYMEIR